MSYSIPSMEDIRLRIRAALDASHGRVNSSGLARELGIRPSQVSSLLKPGGRRLAIDEIGTVERYLGINLIDVPQPGASIGEGVGVPIEGTCCVALRQGRWITVYDGEGDALFLVKRAFPIEHLAAVLNIREQAFKNGERTGRLRMQAAFRKLIGAAEEKDGE